MFYVYILRSSTNDLYIGQTNDLLSREVQQITKSSKAAKFIKDGKEFKLVYKEEYPTRLKAIHREKQIQGHQQGEESVHHELTHKIGRLETKLSRYLQTQEARKGRIQELEDKIRSKFETKREKITALKEDLQKLMKLYNATKKAKAPKTHLLRVAKRIEQVKNKISLLR